MSCTVCTFGKNKSISSFATEHLFIKFKSQIGSLVSSGAMQVLNSHEDNRPFISKHYKCNECSQIWQLEFPDQAFRGGYQEINEVTEK